MKHDYWIARREALACLVGIGAVCLLSGRAESQGGHSFHVYDEAGVTVSRTSGGPAHEGEVFVYREVLRISGDSENQGPLLYRPRSAVMDDDGNIYVVDPEAHRIVQFGPDGEWIQHIGSRGEGPGELLLPIRVGISNGELRVVDGRKRATQVFSTSGEFERIEAWPDFQQTGRDIPEVWRTERGGTVVRVIQDDRSEWRSRRVEMLVFDPAGNERARVESAWVWTGRMVWAETSGGSRRFNLPVHYSGTPYGGYVPGKGIWTSTGEEPVIRWYDLDGSPTARWEIDLAPSPITPADRAAVAANLAEALDEALASSDARSAVAKIRASTVVFADQKAFWGIPAVDDLGYLWVMDGPPLSASSQPRPDSMRVLVLSPEGQFLGRTTLPAPGVISQRHLLTIDEDPATQEFLIRIYGIEPAVAGLEYR